MRFSEIARFLDVLDREIRRLEGTVRVGDRLNVKTLGLLTDWATLRFRIHQALMDGIEPGDPIPDDHPNLRRASAIIALWYAAPPSVPTLPAGDGAATP